MAFPYDQSQAQNLIDGLLTPNAITHDGLLEAVLRTPREAFVPAAFEGAAYADEEIPLPGGRCLMEPLVQLKLLQALAAEPHESVLIIAGTTGYSAALLSGLVARVEMVEEDPAFVAHAQQALQALGIANVNVVQHPLTHGAPGAAPYDAILIEGAVQVIPPSIVAQLKDGGRLLTIENTQLRQGSSSGLGEAKYYEKTGQTLSARVLFDAGVGLLSEFKREPGFSFN